MRSEEERNLPEYFACNRGRVRAGAGVCAVRERACVCACVCVARAPASLEFTSMCMDRGQVYGLQCTVALL